ncbi:MAG: Fic family protein [Candidatus Margulisiibacteriota bacterium]
MININKLTITPEILSIISEIDEFKGSWKAFKVLSPERLIELKKVATIESIGSSNRIEGNKLSDKDVEALLSRIDRTSFTSRDEEEIAGYAVLMDTLFDHFEVIPFTENYIKQLHGILLKYSHKDEAHRGEYKKLSNSVAAYDPDGKQLGIIFETTTPFETPAQMRECVDWIRTTLADGALHPILAIGIFVVTFLAIHPFQDGNGRLSRALTTLLLLQSGYAYVPFSSIEAIVENNKEGYYRALRQTQSTFKTELDYEPWILFFLRTLQAHKRHLEQKIKGINDQLSTLTALSEQIMKLFDKNERITLSFVAESTNANINTIKKHLAELASSGYITKHGHTRGAWYVKTPPTETTFLPGFRG